MKVKDWHSPRKQVCSLGRHSWSVPRLFELARELPVMDVPLDHLSVYYTYEKLTLREMDNRTVRASDLLGGWCRSAMTMPCAWRTRWPRLQGRRRPA